MYLIKAFDELTNAIKRALIIRVLKREIVMDHVDDFSLHVKNVTLGKNAVDGRDDTSGPKAGLFRRVFYRSPALSPYLPCPIILHRLD